jgi:hypothetical protein
MSVGRRQPPPIPTGPPPSVAFVWLKLLELWRWCLQGYIGMPAEHADTHLATGSDPLQTPGTPTAVSLTDTEAGDGPAYAYEDHKHALDSDVRQVIEDDELLSWIL